MEKVSEHKKHQKKYSKIELFILFALITIILAFLMLCLYFFHFSGGFSENQNDWANFGAYMSPIVSLIAFAGVLISINKSEKNTRLQEERDLFFRFLDTRLKSMELLSYINQETNEELVSMKALGAYKNELDLDLQLLIVYWGAFSADSYSDWSNRIEKFGTGNFEEVLFEGMFAYDRNIDRGDIRNIEKTNIKNDPQFYFRDVKKRFEHCFEWKYIEPIYLSFTKEEKFMLCNYAWDTWIYHMDEKERFFVLKAMADSFRIKYNDSLSYHFSNLCNITSRVSKLENKCDYYMEYWASGLTNSEGVLLFFWILGGDYNETLFKIAYEYNLFVNINWQEFCAYKCEGNERIFATNIYLKIQLDRVVRLKSIRKEYNMKSV
ncbi:hypothetical protein [Butyricimonas paravirosa]|uniref:hypothetical protein n=1 Tax=Butyricimonas paravirosa TaxID=1472417 RepID=UPI00210EB648|nr:hypothetical protein [Butyricimonas paravirosa]MCQ4875678.1 hypothetical protein [Butyricimonas paravirosa]